MLRRLLVPVMLVFVMALCSQPAEADWWDYFSELSGPGSFDSRGNVTFSVYCQQSGRFGSTTDASLTADERQNNIERWDAFSNFGLAPGFFNLAPIADNQNDANNILRYPVCLFADIRLFGSDDDIEPDGSPRRAGNRFGPVHADFYEVGPTVRVLPAFEVGLGVGLVHFNSGGVTSNRITLSFPRVVFKPLLLLPSKWIGKLHREDLGFFQMYFRQRGRLCCIHRSEHEHVHSAYRSGEINRLHH